MPAEVAGSAALDYFGESVATAGLEFRPATAGEREARDGLLLLPDGRELRVVIKATSLLSANGLVAKLQDRSTVPRDSGTVELVVADRITESARDVLREAGWSWLDLRGHLRLAADGLLVDINVQPARRAFRKREPFAGRVGIEVAVAALLNPTRPVAIRGVATQIHRAPSSVSDVVAAMRDAELIGDDGVPHIPQLFWELASVWKSTQIDVAELPRDGGLLGALQVNLDQFDEAGWALTDDRAAVAYGARVAIRGDHPHVFYVPDERALRRAARLLGEVRDHHSRKVTLRVAPAPMACSQRQQSSDDANPNAEEWPMTRPLFVALDLAQDPGRGHEILDGWDPPEPWARVW